MEKMKIGSPYLRGVLEALLLVLIIACIGISMQLMKAPDLTDYEPKAENYSSVIVDKDDKVVMRLQLSDMPRRSVELDEVSATLQAKVLQALDENFYDRSAYGELFYKKANSITLGLIRATVSYEEKGEQDSEPSLLERYLAFRIAKKQDRDWILTAYLNTADFGWGIRGIYEAAYCYFGKEPDQLSKNEEDILTLILKNPEKAYETTLRYKTDLKLEWFEDALIQSLVEELQDTYQCSEAEAWAKIYGGGLRIYSTKDEDLQYLCEEASANKNCIVANEQVSIVMIDRSTGGVAAIVGGRVRRDPDDAGIYSGYNRATDVRRNPGLAATIPTVFGTALDAKGITLGTVVDDAPCTDANGKEVDNPSGKHRGRITLQDAIRTGNVVAAYKTRELVETEAIENSIEQMQFAVSQDAVVTAATNMEIAGAYNAIANGGIYKKPVYYTHVTDAEGKTILGDETRGEGVQVFSSATAVLLTSSFDHLKDGVTYENVNATNVACVNCSTEENRNVWCVGFSPYYTCSVWGGNDDSSPQDSSDYVRSIWRNIMDEVHRTIPEAKEEALFDEEGLRIRTICTKCGKLEEKGLCAASRQGPKTADVYYEKGTEPKKRCDCHIELTICTVSQAEAGAFCPKAVCTSGVFLKSGTKGTDDEDFSAEYAIGRTCDVHKTFLDKYSVR